MIVSAFVFICVTPSKLNFYRGFGYSVKNFDKILIPITFLDNSSHTKIICECDFCGNQKNIEYRTYLKSTKNHTESYSCNKCNDIKRKETLKEKYGVENNFQRCDVKEKIKEVKKIKYGDENFNNREKFLKTNLELYGVENPSQLESIKNKKITTCIKNWNVENPSQSDIIKAKKMKSYIENFGVDNPSKSDFVLNKIKKTNYEKWGVEWASQNEIVKSKIRNTIENEYNVSNAFLVNQNENIEIIKKETMRKYSNRIGNEYEILDYNNSMFSIIHKKCNEKFAINRYNLYDRSEISNNVCSKCYPISDQKSIKEKDILNFLKTFNIDIIENDRKVLEGKELDIYIPEYNLAIEFNGLYWHSEKYKDKSYHLDKSLKCLEKGIDLLHIWEDEWVFKQDIVKSIISNRLNKNNKIYARKCMVKSVEGLIVKNFLESNHIDGYVKSDVNIGLYYNNELVCLMCLKKKENDFEIVRTCTKLNHSVVGGVSKLFNHFKKTYKFDNITTSTDFRLFNGKVYQNLGFIKQKLSKPDYFWLSGSLRESKNNPIEKQKKLKIYDSGKCLWILK